MTNKRYYWLKLRADFFESEGRDVLKRSINGLIVLALYLKLMLVTMNTEGIIGAWRFDVLDERKIAGMTGLPCWMVKRAYAKLSDLGFVSRLDDGSIKVNGMEDIVGSETESAVRMRKKRGAHCAQDGEQCDVEKDKDSEIYSDKKSEREVNMVVFTPPTQDEINEYARELGDPYEAERFYDFYSMRNWKIDGDYMSDWKAALRMWLKRKPEFDKYEGRKQYVDDGIEFYFGED